MMMVQLPNVGHVKLRLEPTTTARDLLPHIAKKHRIRLCSSIPPFHQRILVRLYTEDYIFTLSIEDQTRLKVYSSLPSRVIFLDSYQVVLLISIYLS